MADVSVEFGAKDTGLENTLKTVQDELARLDEKVKGGELSFNELQSTMKKVAQAEKLQAQLEGMAQATGDAGNAAGAAAPKVDEVGKETKKAGKEAEDFGEKSKGGFLKMAGAVAAGQLAAEAAMAGIRAAINLAKASIDEFGAALDLGGRLSDLAARTGEAEGNLLLLERAFQNSGAGAEQVGPAINKLQRFMEEASNGAAAQVDTMDRLGLSYDELAGKTPTEQLEIFAKRISSIEDPTKRAALAMDVFGRSGGELLPLLTNFSGELGTAQGQLGGMVNIMNRNAAVFDAVSDKIAIVQGKFMEFAAGILDRIVPALDAITEGLSRIDAAAIGQKLADAFLGGTQAMDGFQAAVDAFKVGEFGKAFELIFESIKLQLMQTGNAIITNFTAAFKTVGDIMAEIFRPDGPSFMVVRSAFDFLAGYAKEKIAGAMSDMFAGMGPAFSQTTEALKIAAEAGASSAEMALQRIPVAAGLAAEDIGNVLANSTQTFKDNLAESESKFFDIGEQSAKVASLQDEITAAVAKTNEEKGKGAPVDEKATEEAEKQNRINAEIAAEKAKMQGLQSALNTAIQSGNELEQQTIQKLIDTENAKARIKKLTEDYIATGLGEKEAAQLAANLVSAENTARGISATGANATTNFNNAANAVKSVKEAIDKADKAKMDNPPKSMNERLAKAQESLSKMKDFIGEDMNKMSLADIMKKMGLSASALMSTDEKLKMVEEAVKKLEDADPADLTPTVDKVGVNDNLEKVKEYLAKVKAPDATPHIDQEKLQAGIAETKKQFEGHLSKFEAVVVPKFDTASLQEQIDVAVQSSKGTEHLSNIDKLVVKIQELVGKIEGKLPMQALAY
jgi:hypothetical protein